MGNVSRAGLLCIVAAAVFTDIRSGRIPNGLIIIGLFSGGVSQMAAGGGMGVILFLGGVFVPVLLAGGLYYFRMIGAGDIKLLSVLGGFLGPVETIGCMIVAALFGGVIAAVIVVRRRSLWERLSYFAEYAAGYSRDRQWRSYIEGTQKKDRFCFSVPVFLSVLCYVGGFI